MGRAVKGGTADQSTVIRIIDSTTFLPETGVTSATTGLDLKYRREGAVAVSITESDLSALTDAHSDGGMLHIGAGYYRIDLPDAAFTAGVTGVLVFGTVTDMIVIGDYHPIVAYDPADGVRLGLTALPNAAADAAGGLPISDAGGLDLYAILADTADMQPKLGTIVDLGGGATIGANLVDIEGQTDDIGTAGAGLTAVPWNAAWDAEVESEVTDALNAYDPPTYTELLNLIRVSLRKDAALATDLAALLTTLNADLGSGAGSYASTTDSQEAIRDRGDAAWITSTFSITAGAIADQVWEEAIADHSGTAGSTAEALAAAGSAGDPWITALPGAYGAGSAGKIVGDNLNATVSSRASQTTADAIETDTQDIQSRLPAALVSGRIDASVGAMAVNTLTASALAADAVTEIQVGLATAASIAALNNLSAAQVRAEVDAAIETYGLDHLVSASVAGTDIANDSIFAKLASKTAPADWDSFVNTSDSLEAVRDAITSLPSNSSIADAVWDESTGTHLTVGTFGKIVNDIYNDTNELQGDWTDGGRLDLLIDALPTNAQMEARTLVAANYATAANQTTIITDIAALPTAIENADALLIRNVSNVEATAAEDSLCTIVLAALHWTLSGTTLTIYRTDGSTPHATKTATTDTDLDLVKGIS